MELRQKTDGIDREGIMDQLKNNYSSFFRLEINPFGETPDPDFYYASPQHNHALQDLMNAIREGKGFSLLTGEVGTGKTLITRLLLEMIKEETNTALILYPKFSEIELLQAILEEFEVPTAEIELDTVKSYVDHLNHFLLESIEGGRRSVLMVDEAQILSHEVLETIRLLTNLETKTHKLLQIVLIAQPEMSEILDQINLRQLKQRISVHAKIRGLDSVETERYIQRRIELTGCENFIRFESGVCKLIHQLSRGIPRRINQLSEQVMRAAEDKRVRLVSIGFACETLNYKHSLFMKEKTT